MAVEPEPEPEPEDPPRYDGPRVWVHQDTYSQNPDGTYTKQFEAGWHYSTRLVTVKHRIEVQAEGDHPEVREWEETREVPDRKLHLNDEDELEHNWFYEFAKPHHKSWVEKHGTGNPLPVQPLAPGIEHPVEAHDTHPNHLEWHQAFLRGEV